eukprot:7251021-Pyramimonas_sp.AAC.1
MGWDNTPYLEPVLSELRSMRGRGEDIQADLVGAHCSGGPWAQLKLFQERNELSPTCRWCQQASGYIGHRLHICDGLAAGRREQDFGELHSIYHEAGYCPLTEYGVTSSRRDEFPPPLQGSEVGY